MFTVQHVHITLHQYDVVQNFNTNPLSSFLKKSSNIKGAIVLLLKLNLFFPQLLLASISTAFLTQQAFYCISSINANTKLHNHISLTKNTMDVAYLPFCILDVHHFHLKWHFYTTVQSIYKDGVMPLTNKLMVKHIHQLSQSMMSLLSRTSERIWSHYLMHCSFFHTITWSIFQYIIHYLYFYWLFPYCMSDEGYYQKLSAFSLLCYIFCSF